MNSLKGLFAGKRTAAIPPPVPSADIEQLSSPRKRDTTGRENPMKDADVGGSPASDPGAALSRFVQTDSPEVRKIANFAISAWNEASEESDMPKKERLFSMASVMLDALSNSRQAEKAMLEAQQAAAAAKNSYELTQHSILEMGRLLSKSHNMPAFMRKLAARTSR